MGVLSIAELEVPQLLLFGGARSQDECGARVCVNEDVFGMGQRFGLRQTALAQLLERALAVDFVGRQCLEIRKLGLALFILNVVGEHQKFALREAIALERRNAQRSYDRLDGRERDRLLALADGHRAVKLFFHHPSGGLCAEGEGVEPT